MKTFNLKKLTIILTFVSMLIVSSTLSCSASSTGSTSTDVSLQITSWTVEITAPSVLDFWTWKVSSSNWKMEIDLVTYGSWDTYFIVEDLAGSASGYTVSLQMWGDLIHATSTSSTISKDNVKLSQNYNSWITVLDALIDTAQTWGVLQSKPSEVYMPTSQTDVSLGTAVPVIERLVPTTPDPWIVWKYGIQPLLYIDVPSFSRVWNYTATLLFTVVEH